MRLPNFLKWDRISGLLRPDCSDLITEVVEIKPFSQERPTVIFCIFQRFNDDFTCMRQLRLYQKLNFNLLVVSNSAVSAGLRKELDRTVNVLLVRGNVGYDFAAYRCGVRYLKARMKLVKNFVIICNDSCLGPYQNEAVFSSLSNCEELILKGMTDSYGGGHYHLQSYWLFFTSILFNSSIFDYFFSNIKNLNNKKKIIKFYEVGLSKYLLENGVKISPLFPYASIRNLKVSNYVLSSEKPRNPTIHFGFDLFINHDFPFIKKELVEKSACQWEFLNKNFRDEIEKYIELKNKNFRFSRK